MGHSQRAGILSPAKSRSSPAAGQPPPDPAIEAARSLSSGARPHRISREQLRAAPSGMDLLAAAWRAKRGG